MNILLLEDDMALNKAIKKVIELDNHTVTNLYDGAEVLGLIEHYFDLYIFDINVPNIDGLELLNLIYNRNSNAKVIMISSNNDVNTLQKAYKYGCMDYLQKPFHLEELRIKIDKIKVKTEDILSSIVLKKNEVLTKKEKDLLLLFLEYKGKVVTYNMIDEHIYQDKVMSMNSLRSMVRRVRKKIAKNIISNVLDEGYTLK